MMVPHHNIKKIEGPLDKKGKGTPQGCLSQQQLVLLELLVAEWGLFNHLPNCADQSFGLSTKE